MRKSSSKGKRNNRTSGTPRRKAAQRAREEVITPEVVYLRSLVADLLNRLLEFKAQGQGVGFTPIEAGATPPPYPQGVDMALGKVLSMEAKTEEEKKQKEEAVSQIKTLMGG